MILSVHQPQYLPWLGFFHKIAKSDIFVFLDDVQYKKREFQNRNKIRTKDGWLWLTVPVITKGKYTQKILEVEIDNTSDWAIEHFRSIELNYSKAEFFKEHRNFFESLYKKKWEKLIDINLEIIKYIMNCWNIKTPVYFSSSLNLQTSKTQRIIDICKHFKADTYLSGSGGKDYLEESLFHQNNIKLIYQKFEHPVYQQCFSGFEPYMSAIDLLFNCGQDGRKYLEI